MGSKQYSFTPTEEQRELIETHCEKLKNESKITKKRSQFLRECLEFYFNQQAEIKGKEIPVIISRGNLRKLNILIEAEEIPKLSSFIDYLIREFLTNYVSSEERFKEVSEKCLKLTLKEKNIEEQYLKK